MYHLMTMEPVNEAGTVAVRFTIEGRSSVLGAADVDTLIEKLVELRGGMSPAHSMMPMPTRNYPLEVDPSWHVDRTPLFEGPVLMLRHAGIGWTAYALPARSVCQLVGALGKPTASAFAPHPAMN
jgi:hypothetical protein